MKKNFIPMVVAVAALLASCGSTAKSSSKNPTTEPQSSQVTKYTVTVNTSEDFEVTGLNQAGYAEGETVTFRINVTNEMKEVDRVIVDKKALEAKEDGSYSFTMGNANVVINVTLKDKEGIKTATVELSSSTPSVGDEVAVTMKLDGTAVTEGVTVEATKGADLVQISGTVVKCIAVGDVTLDVKATVDGTNYEKTIDFTIAEGVKTVAISTIMQTAATYSGQKATYGERIAVEGRVININYNGPVIYDGTGIISAYTKQLTTDYPSLNLQVGDYVRVTGTPTRYKASDTDERAWQFTCYNSTDKKLDVTFSKLTVHKDIALPELTDEDFTSDDLSAYKTSATGEVRYVKFTAKASISGTHVNLLLKKADGTYTQSPSISYYNGGTDLIDGALYTMKAFLSDFQQGKYLVAYVIDDTVERTYEAATEVSISGPEILLLANTDGVQLTASVSPDAANQKVTWTSETPNIATVDENGLVKPVAIGEATIKAAASETVFATCTIKVVEQAVSATGVTLSQETASLKIGGTVTLTATPEPENTTDTLKWASANPTIATVANGVVTAVAAGTVNITATYGSVSATCEVTVINQYGTAENPVDVAGALQVAEDECKTDKAYSSQEVYVTGKIADPGTYNSKYNNYTNIVLKSLDGTKSMTIYRAAVAEGVDAPEVNDIIKVHGFMQKYGTALQMSHKEKTTPQIYANENGVSKVTATGENVTFNGLPEEAVANGTSVAFTVTVAEGYILDGVTLNGKTITAGDDGNYTFTVSGDMKVTASTHKEVEVTAKTQSIKYSGGTTNMTGGNDAAKFGLDATVWSVVGDKKSGNNRPGLNQAGEFRLYNQTYITISALKDITIQKVAFTAGKVSKKSLGKLAVTSGISNTAVTAVDDTYAVTDNTITIANSLTTSSQLAIKEFVVYYTIG